MKLDLDRAVLRIMAIAAIVAGVLYVRSCVEDYADRRVLTLTTNAVDSAVADWRTAYEALERLAIARKDSLVQLQARQDTARAQIIRAAPAVDTLIAQVPDSVLRVAIDSALTVERTAREDERSALLAQVVMLRAQVDERTRLLANARARIEGLTVNRDAWMRARTPGRFACVGGVGGVVNTGGGAAGVGVMCGVKLF